jgi:hypothetical protein
MHRSQICYDIGNMIVKLLKDLPNRVTSSDSGVGGLCPYSYPCQCIVGNPRSHGILCDTRIISSFAGSRG